MLRHPAPTRRCSTRVTDAACTPVCGRASDAPARRVPSHPPRVLRHTAPWSPAMKSFFRFVALVAFLTAGGAWLSGSPGGPAVAAVPGETALPSEVTLGGT